MLGPKGVISLQYDEEEHSETPKVSINGYMVFFRNDFRSHIGGCPTKGVNGTRRHWFQAKAEIDQLKLFVSVEQNILGLDIAVDYVPLVQIFEGFSYRFEYLLCLWLLESVLGFREQIIVQGVGAAVLLDQKDLAGAFDGVDKFGYDWVVEFC